ncbi:MAG: hypothetical protein CSA33_02085 [Desulfobulbus propionicus]|nr:MAG: hypothetical protein CSA33_02085 [Desulfobulbus propionicus]
MIRETMPVAILARVEEYAAPDFSPLLSEMLTQTLYPQELKGALVLLKPNLITARGGPLSCTNRAVILAVSKWFLDQGARVQVGDSPAFGSAASVLDSLQLTEALDALGVTIVEFDRLVSRTLPSGETVKVAARALECDLLVNLPKCKAHVQTRVTLAIKNYYGCVAGIRKAWWHMIHGGESGRFADLIVQLPLVLAPSISLVDGIEAMHKNGPVHGVPFPAGILAAGQNPVALETVLLHVLGVASHSCPLWNAAVKQGLEGTTMGACTWLTGENPGYQIEGFQVPSELMPVRFNPFRFVRSSLQRFLLS